MDDAPQLDTSLSVPGQFIAAARSWTDRRESLPSASLVDYSNQYSTLAEAWKRLEWPEYRLWMLRWAADWGLIQGPSAPDLVRFACWCARRAVSIWRPSSGLRYLKPRPAEKRPFLRVVRTSEEYAVGKASAADVARIAETMFPPDPLGCVFYRWEYRLLRSACLEAAALAIEDPWQAAKVASAATVELATGGDIKTKEKTAEGWKKARADARVREGLAHAQKLHRVFGNPFVSVSNKDVLRITKAIGIRPWECSNCGGRTSEVVERPDGRFRRCQDCKALHSRLPQLLRLLLSGSTSYLGTRRRILNT
jgi:hypothetical protein